MFNDPHAKVREAISWVMSKICEHHADVFANTQYMNTIIPLFLERIQDRPSISNQVCRAIENLSISIANVFGTHQSSMLSPYFSKLFQALINNGFRTDYEGTSSNLALASFTSLTAICENADIDCYQEMYEFLQPTLQLLE